MVRPLRIVYPGAVYHLTARGNRKEDIFLCDEDRLNFLQILGKTITRYNWICHAYCLMDNHYHILAETPDANLSLGMRQLNGMYTQYSNRRHDKVGHVFQGRYKSILVEKHSHLLELCRYIVCNPVRVGICTNPEGWGWSSYIPTAFKKSPPEFLTVDWVLSQFSKNRNTARKKYRKFVLAGLSQSSSPLKKVVGQILFGSQQFIEEMQTYLLESKNIKEISRIQRVAGRPSLTDIFSTKIKSTKTMRNKSICKAHLDFGYTQKKIADHLGIHYTTVSKILSSGDD